MSRKRARLDLTMKQLRWISGVFNNFSDSAETDLGEDGVDDLHERLHDALEKFRVQP